MNQPAPAPIPTEERAVAHRLSTLDRYLPAWIGLAMAAACSSAGGCPASPMPYDGGPWVRLRRYDVTASR